MSAPSKMLWKRVDELREAKQEGLTPFLEAAKEVYEPSDAVSSWLDKEFRPEKFRPMGDSFRRRIGTHWRLFCEHAFPHIVIGILGGLGAVILADPVWKVVVLSAASLAVAGVVGIRWLLPGLRKHFRDAKNAHRRSTISHRLAHETRDELVRLMSPVPLASRSYRCLPSLHEPGSFDVSRLLMQSVDLLKTHVSDDLNVWASLRELRADGKYYTVARVGEGFNPAREKDSTPLQERSTIIQHLRNSYNRQRGVILTGSTREEDLWTPQANDRFGDDKSVLMGAVIVKSAMDKSPEDRLMVWIISICSDADDVFSSAHLPVMQSITDLFSILANVLARESWQRRPPDS